MAKYRITKQVDFGPYTILGASGLQSDQVPLNNYAPKIGDVIEGPIGSQVHHGVTVTGVVFPIATNGAASTTGQKSIQIVPLDDVELYTPSVPNDNGTPSDPSNTNPSNSNNGPQQVNGGISISPNAIRNFFLLLLVVAIVGVIVLE